MGHNQVGGIPCDREMEWRYYESLPSEWRRWIRELEFDVGCRDIYWRWISGESLGVVKAIYNEWFMEYKRRHGFRVGYNG